MRWAVGLLLMAFAGRAGAQQPEIVMGVRMALSTGDFTTAERMMAAYTKDHGATPESILASSWIARGMLDAGRLEEAEKQAAETRKMAIGELEHRKLDADGELPLALGAAIEVQGQAMVKRGARSEAVSFLRVEAVRWKDTSIRARIQKNLNLLTLEGKPAPAIDVSHWVGEEKPRPLSALRGHPVLLFFWAHWCGDCKAEVSVLQDLNARYGHLGLQIVGPTQHYGFTAGGQEASPEQETAWIEQVRQKYYARIGKMPVPVSEQAMSVYGVSTTPTLVLVDAAGTVRMYHPGVMSLQELGAEVAKVLK